MGSKFFFISTIWRPPPQNHRTPTKVSRVATTGTQHNSSRHATSTTKRLASENTRKPTTTYVWPCWATTFTTVSVTSEATALKDTVSVRKQAEIGRNYADNKPACCKGLKALQALRTFLRSLWASSLKQL